MDGIPFGVAILGLNYGPGGGRDDGLSPSEVVLQTNAKDEVMKQAGTIGTRSSALRIDTYEIESVSLAE